jgi:hypothetical protein
MVECFCANSKIYEREPKKIDNEAKQQDGQQMSRYNCQGCIKFVFSFFEKDRNVLSITCAHQHHEPYRDFYTSDDVKNFITDRQDKTPTFIYQELKNSPLRKTSAKNTTRSQVHYWWIEGTKRFWYRAKDGLESSKILLQQYESELDYICISSPHIKALGFKVKANVSNVALRNASEFLMDATCK